MSDPPRSSAFWGNGLCNDVNKSETNFGLLCCYWRGWGLQSPGCLPESTSVSSALGSHQGPSRRFQSGTKPRAFVISGQFICQCTETHLAWAKQGDNVWAKSRVCQPLAGSGVCLGLMEQPWCCHDATPQRFPDAAPVSSLAQACPCPSSPAPHSRGNEDTSASPRPHLSPAGVMVGCVQLCLRCAQQHPRCIRLCRAVLVSELVRAVV